MVGLFCWEDAGYRAAHVERCFKVQHGKPPSISKVLVSSNRRSNSSLVIRIFIVY